METLISRNPATGATIAELQSTAIDSLPGLFEKARVAQKGWAALSVKKRARALLQLRETLINQADSLSELISRENGKPRFEALSNEILPSVDMLSYFARKSPRLLKDRKIPLSLMKHRQSYLNYWPIGVVAIISPWNYPFLLPFGEILMALAAGNAVVFKPSEITPMIGLKIQEIFDLSGLPSDLLQTLIGDGTLGAAIIQQRPGKIFFTGSAATGKAVMAAAAEYLIPVNLELGGKDAMIVLPDADIDYATSAALWGGFSNSGQVCASTERILVHESMVDTFVRTLKAKTEKLRQGSPLEASVDLGVVTFEKQKKTYERQLTEARVTGAHIITGGDFNLTNTALQPTIVCGENIEKLAVYSEETFGPVVAVATYKTVAEAVKKANDSKYGLVASVITKDLSLGEEVAKQLEVGTVTINEVLYTAGLGETPWGGLKESGIGRSHADMGLLEFVNVRHIHKPLSRLSVFKSPWWFPYTPYQYATFREGLNLYRRHWTDKLKALPLFLWNLLQFLKTEKRL